MEALEANRQLATLLRQDFAIDQIEASSEEDLLRMLVDHLDFLIDKRMEWLLSLMYRMDIDEAKVQAALLPTATEPANIGLARLIIERQKRRIYTKQHYRPEDLGKEWEW
ncbi:hypothetical protein [Lewinella cohaerens]|uniref:hypothetical protein n=1 Tax=Lewinella cohaerens TaxID=70995 RepID=UPI000370786E|nr:hypothetical protein [Lewinella cohaerens]